MSEVDDFFIKPQKESPKKYSWKFHAALSAIYTVMYTTQLILYEKGYVDVEECSSLNNWVWFMNAFMVANLGLNILMTIHIRFKGDEIKESYIKNLDKAHYLCLFCVIIWVIYSQFVIYNENSLQCKSTYGAYLWGILMFYSCILYLIGALFMLGLAYIGLACIVQRCEKPK